MIQWGTGVHRESILTWAPSWHVVNFPKSFRKILIEMDIACSLVNMDENILSYATFLLGRRIILIFVYSIKEKELGCCTLIAFC